MTKHVFTPNTGWKEVVDAQSSTTLTIEERAPATVFEDEPQEVKFDPEKLPFERVINRHLIVVIDKYKRPKGRRIVLSDKEKRSSTKGNVVALADDITDIKIGDKVLFTQYGGFLLVFDGIPLMRSLSYEEIISVLKPNAPDLVSEGA